MLFALILLLFLGLASGARYEPGNPGGPWTEDEAVAIRDKLHYLWEESNRNTFSRRFANMNSEDWKKSKKKQPAMYNDWVYDPTKRLDTVDCGYYGLCRYLYNVIVFSKCPKCVIQLHLYMQEQWIQRFQVLLVRKEVWKHGIFSTQSHQVYKTEKKCLFVWNMAMVNHESFCF